MLEIWNVGGLKYRRIEGFKDWDFGGLKYRSEVVLWIVVLGHWSFGGMKCLRIKM